MPKVGVNDISANIFIEKLAAHLKSQGSIQQPNWSTFVKTSVARQFSPENQDWYYIRSAAILRRLYCEGTQTGNGMGDLRRMFGGCKDGSVVPRHFKLASGQIITTIIKQAQKLGYVEKSENGRKLSEKGKKFLD